MPKYEQNQFDLYLQWTQWPPLAKFTFDWMRKLLGDSRWNCMLFRLCLIFAAVLLLRCFDCLLFSHPSKLKVNILTSEFLFRLQIQETAWFQWVKLHIENSSPLFSKWWRWNNFTEAYRQFRRNQINLSKWLIHYILKWFIHLRQTKKWGNKYNAILCYIKLFSAMVHELFVKYNSPFSW